MRVVCIIAERCSVEMLPYPGTIMRREARMVAMRLLVWVEPTNKRCISESGSSVHSFGVVCQWLFASFM